MIYFLKLHSYFTLNAELDFENFDDFLVYFNEDEKYNYKTSDVFCLTPTILHGLWTKHGLRQHSCKNHISPKMDCQK
jgi:hypothetical protein